MSHSHTNSRAAIELLPAERAALTIALSRVERGAEPLPNVTAVCVMALARLAGLREGSAFSSDEEVTRG